MITLKKLFIKNFKAFQEEQTIPLERITLIFGKNSAGKSTILHAVALLRQLLQTGGKMDMAQLLLANKQLNVGSLDEVRFDHDPDNCPTLSVECLVDTSFGSLVPDNVLGSPSILNNDDDDFTDIEDDGEGWSNEEYYSPEPEFVDFTDEDGHHYSSEHILAPKRSILPRTDLPITPSNQQEDPWSSLEKPQDGGWPDSLDKAPDRPFCHLTKLQEGDSIRATWKLHKDFHILQIDLNNETIAIYEGLGLEEFGNNQNESRLPTKQTLFLAHPLVKRTRELLYRCAIRNGNKEREERSTEDKVRSRNQFYWFFDKWFESHLKNFRLTPYEYLYSGQEQMRVNFHLESFNDADFPEDFQTACRDTYIADLDPDERSGTRYDAVREEVTKLFNAVAPDYLGWMVSNLHFEILKAVERCLGTDYIPAHRPPPRDVTRTRISEWITQGASTRSWIQLFDEKVLYRFNAWLDYLGVEFTAVCRKLEIHDPDAPRNPIAYDPQIVFAKPGRNLRSSHADLGYGVGQLVPILVAGSSPEARGIKIVEQPEAQVHPGLQAKMGDFFIGQSSNWLIETHSEHLILRLLRRIRETHAAPHVPSKRKEDPWDWVQPENQASEVGILTEVPGALRLNANEISVVYIESGKMDLKQSHFQQLKMADFQNHGPAVFLRSSLRNSHKCHDLLWFSRCACSGGMS